MTTAFGHDGTTIAYTGTGAPAGRSDAPTVVFGHGLLFGGWMFGPAVVGGLLAGFLASVRYEEVPFTDR